MIERVLNKWKAKLEAACDKGHISNSERVLSVIAGGFIVCYSAKRLLRSPLTAVSGVTMGGALLLRGLSGKCPLKGLTEQAEQAEEAKLTLIERRYFEPAPAEVN